MHSTVWAWPHLGPGGPTPGRLAGARNTHGSGEPGRTSPERAAARFASAVAEMKKKNKEAKKEKNKNSSKNQSSQQKGKSASTTDGQDSQKKKKEKKKVDPNEVCWVCKSKGQHFFWKCGTLRNMSPEERNQQALAENRCILCLNESHQGPCVKLYPCRRHCKDPGSHHYILHDDAVHAP